MRRSIRRTVGLVMVLCAAALGLAAGESHAQDAVAEAAADATAETAEAAGDAAADAADASADAAADAAGAATGAAAGAAAEATLPETAALPEAVADEVSPEAAAAELAADETLTETERRGLEEIVITARKREERLQDVPISVTAVTGSRLEMEQINQTLDLQFKVPNLSFGKTNFTSSNLQIRGIGSAVVGSSGEPAVGVHVNTVPQTASRIFEQEFFDVERIEVLRGPQGTLFGRNSTGGSFNVYTRKPTDEFETTGEFQFGNYDMVKLNGTVNIPIGDRLRTRIGGMFRDRDGYINNLQTGNYIDDRQLWSVRGSFQLDITDDFQADVMVNYFREEDARSRIGKQLCTKDTNESPYSLGCDARGPQGFGTPASHGTLGGILETWGLANVNPAFSLWPFVPETTTGTPPPGAWQVPIDSAADAVNPPDLRVHAANRDPEYFADELLAILDLHYDFSDVATSWVTGYQRTNVQSRQDYNMAAGPGTWEPGAMAALITVFPTIDGPAPGDFSALCLGRFGCRDTSFGEDLSQAASEQISTELRSVSDYEGRFNFTTGAIFSYFSTSSDYKVFFSGAEVLGRIQQSVNPAYDPELFNFNNETKPAITRSFGLFGEGYLDITDSTKLTLGLRYTYDNKTAKSRNYLLDSSGTLPEWENQEATWNNGTGRIAIDQQLPLSFTDDSMIFLSGSRGTKPGGFNPPAVAGSLAPETFDQEIVWAIEAGSKNLFWDNRVQANLTGFFYDYDGYQVSKIVERTSVNENIDAYVWGLEAEFVAKPIDPVDLFFNIAYLGSSIQNTSSIDTADITAGDPAYLGIKDLSNGSNFLCPSPCIPPFVPPGTGLPAGVDPAGIPKNLHGNELPNSPDIQISLGGQYAYDVGRIGVFTARISYYWQSEMYARIFNESRDYVASWSQADAGLRWNSESERFYVDLWIKNFTDNADITGQYLTDASSGNFTNVFVLEPRTFGATIGFAF